MKILVDADACPVIDIIEKIAKTKQISVILFCDTNHVLFSDYSDVKVVGAGADAVDFKLVNECRAEDIVVTQDYGLAAMVLSKKAYAIHQNGRWYTEENIERLLAERAMAKKVRRASGKNHIKGPRKRTEEDDVRFEESLKKLIDRVTDICSK